MKKTALAIFSLMMVLSIGLLGCSSPSPSEVVGLALDAVKAGDQTALSKYYETSDLNPDETNPFNLTSPDGEGESQADLNENAADAITQYCELLYDFDYVIGEEKIDGDKATVSVSLTTHDMAAVLRDALQQFFVDGMKLALSQSLTGGAQPSEDEMSDLLASILKDKIEENRDSTISSDVVFHLTKSEGAWKIDTLDDSTRNALLGGIEEYIKQLESMSANL